MNRLWKFTCVGLLVTGWVGCGSSGSAPTGQTPVSEGQDPSSFAAQAAPAAQAPQQPVVLPVDANSTPQEVVLAFLNGMRDGNGGITGGLLTKRAQEETVKHNWPVQPPGAPSATYELGQVGTDPAQTVAKVPCVWSEPDGNGGNVRFEVEWALRREPEGWRVAGFATEVVPGREPFFFNFEDIAGLREAQSEAEAAIAEATGAASEEEAAVAENVSRDNKLR